MQTRQQLLRRLALHTDSRIVLLVLDGVGDIRTGEQPQTPLELARTPHLDRLAAASSLGRIVPATPGQAAPDRAALPMAQNRAADSLRNPGGRAVARCAKRPICLILRAYLTLPHRNAT